MNWPHIITANRDTLLRIVAALCAMAGIVDSKAVAHLPRCVRFSILRSLRPVESATRRIIAISAHFRALKARLTAKKAAAKAPPAQPIPKGSGARIPSFSLFDPRKFIGERPPRRSAPGIGPRISFFGGDGWDAPRTAPPSPPLPDAPVDAAQLCRRLLALQRALGDVPREARRLLRAQARREVAANWQPVRVMRPGRPPGHKARGKSEIDEVLSDCHQLALMALAAPDTS